MVDVMTDDLWQERRCVGDVIPPVTGRYCIHDTPSQQFDIGGRCVMLMMDELDTKSYT